MIERIIKASLNNWKWLDDQTLTFAKNIPSNKWHTKPFEPRFKSFACEFACILNARLAYIEFFKDITRTRIMGYSKGRKEKIEQYSKNEVFNELLKCSEEINKGWNNWAIEERECFEMKNVLGLTIFDAMKQHERIHHGKFILYFAKVKIEIPESFRIGYGESNFPHK
ncbi:MAG TPA: DinB family protein [Candidatus Dojkabacteria bacterium]|nr:DinB family protein [Candidatus Dojkabacteria bacterium]HQF36319.1 DinB family protein [Candidatus Dojkabacteria bacterium]